MTSRRPCLCTKTNLWELNSFRMLGSVQTQQLPTLLRQQCWKLLRACWQWCANGCNNSQQVWDLQCIVGRIQLISQQRWKSCQTDPTLLRYASAITLQKKCWELLAEKFDRFQTLRNNTQQHSTTCNRMCKWTQHVTSNNVGSCWPTMLRPFAWGYLSFIPSNFQSC